MIKLLHPIAGTLAFLLIATFWLSTLGVELFGAKAHVVAVKSAIPYALIVLVPAMITIGGTGELLAKGRRSRVLDAKTRRMRVIVANGLFVLIPSAFFLSWKAR